MRIPGFLGPTHPGRSTFLQSDRTINFYPEVVTNDQNAKTMIGLIGTPGTKLLTVVGNGPVRGSHVFGGMMYVVSGNGLYSFAPGAVVSDRLGTLSTKIGPVVIKDNGLKVSGIGGNQIAIVDGAGLYIFDVSTSTFSTVALGFSPTHLTYLDGYFIVVEKDSMNYHVSNLYDGTTWNALASSPVSSTPDNLIACADPYQQLWLIKEYRTEMWYDAGVETSIGSPFQRIAGGVLDYGTSAPHSVVVGDNAVYMLGNVRVGNEAQLLGIMSIGNGGAKVVSPPSVNYKISKISTTNDAQGFMYSDEGHTFYVLTFPSGDTTLVFDTITGMMHERSSWKGNPYVTGRHFVNSYSKFAGKHYIGDYRSGSIYEMSSDYLDDNGDPIVSTRIVPHLFDPDVLGNLFIHRLIVDAEMGVGDNSGSEPAAVLSWSNDGGNTWGNEYPASIGKQGEYKKMLRWRRLGRAKDRVFRLMISDPCKRLILGGYMEASL